MPGAQEDREKGISVWTADEFDKRTHYDINVVVLEVVETQGLSSDFVTQTLKLIEEEARRGAPSSLEQRL